MHAAECLLQVAIVPGNVAHCKQRVAPWAQRRTNGTRLRDEDDRARRLGAEKLADHGVALLEHEGARVHEQLSARAPLGHLVAQEGEHDRRFAVDDDASVSLLLAVASHSPDE